MSKTSLCIKMLEILNSRDVVSRAELAELLETNERNINEYKSELERCGYDIETHYGPQGGYSLNKETSFPSVKLSEEEKKALLEANEYLNSRYDFLHNKNYTTAIGKVLANVKIGETIEKKPPIIIDRFPLIMPRSEIEKRYNLLQEAIDNNLKVEMDYLSSSNKINHHLIQPYQLFMFNLAWYVIAFVDYSNQTESMNKIASKPAYFKLNRIDNLSLTKEVFLPNQYFNVSEFLDSFGMKNNGDFIPIELKLKPPYAALVKERIYGKNQEIITVDKDTTILKCEMQNLNNIVSFILGFGSKVEVISPLEVKEKVIEEAKRLLANMESPNEDSNI